jgi:hypothetical protein
LPAFFHLTDLHRGGIFGEAFSYQLTAVSHKRKRFARHSPKPEKNLQERRAPYPAFLEKKNTSVRLSPGVPPQMVNGF